MKIKIIEGGAIKTLVYRPWNGIQYGADKSEEIIRQYSPTTFDRAIGAHVMSLKTYTFWEQYFDDLERDEKQIREAYLTFFPNDVEEYLRRELDIAGDNPALHHAARQQAINALHNDFPDRVKAIKRKRYTRDMAINVIMSHENDLDIITYINSRRSKGETITSAVKNALRMGIKIENELEKEREASIERLKKQGWI